MHGMPGARMASGWTDTSTEANLVKDIQFTNRHQAEDRGSQAYPCQTQSSRLLLVALIHG